MEARGDGVPARVPGELLEGDGEGGRLVEGVMDGEEVMERLARVVTIWETVALSLGSWWVEPLEEGEGEKENTEEEAVEEGEGVAVADELGVWAPGAVTVLEVSAVRVLRGVSVGETVRLGVPDASRDVPLTVGEGEMVSVFVLVEQGLLVGMEAVGLREEREESVRDTKGDLVEEGCVDGVGNEEGDMVLEGLRELVGREVGEAVKVFWEGVTEGEGEILGEVLILAWLGVEEMDADTEMEKVSLRDRVMVGLAVPLGVTGGEAVTAGLL